jgi:hypothetical protein
MNALKTWLDAAPPAFDSPGELDTFLAEKAAQESMMLRRIAEPDAALLNAVSRAIADSWRTGDSWGDVASLVWDAIAQELTHDR